MMQAHMNVISQRGFLCIDSTNVNRQYVIYWM